jgi:hypothetical protein
VHDPKRDQHVALEATTLRPKPASVHSADGGHKFNLKDLLASGPKLARKSSARSTASSKKSDSDGAGPKSTAGDSAASLSQKYGVCQKIAIGKGATSVVRLAHKWDRSEEKLYAIKVRLLADGSITRFHVTDDPRSSENDARTNQKENTSRNSLQNSASRRPYTMSTS